MHPKTALTFDQFFNYLVAEIQKAPAPGRPIEHDPSRFTEVTTMVWQGQYPELRDAYISSQYLPNFYKQGDAFVCSTNDELRSIFDVVTAYFFSQFPHSEIIQPHVTKWIGQRTLEFSKLQIKHAFNYLNHAIIPNPRLWFYCAQLVKTIIATADTYPLGDHKKYHLQLTDYLPGNPVGSYG